MSPPDKVHNANEKPRLCDVCQFAELACSVCKRKFGITVEWAATFLAFASWKEVTRYNKRDREYVINAAIKAHHQSKRFKTESLWWVRQAKSELMNAQ